MNFLAHGRLHLDRPYFVAGTAVPDWLNVVDRRIRARARFAEPYLDDSRESMRQVAAGVQQHHIDDQWFHRGEQFHALSMRFSLAAAELLADDEGFRPSFLGHILVELLLDAELMRRQPQLLDDYYAALDAIDAETVAGYVSEMTGKDASGLAEVVNRFRDVRFLADYSSDSGLLMRLNGVMLRVGLPLLPDHIQSLLSDARTEVAEAADPLLSANI